METERLILRRFRESDAADLLDYLSRINVNCFFDMKINTLDEAKQQAIERSKETQPYFAIELKTTGKVIGEVFAFLEEDSGDTYSPCWLLNPDFQKKGYAFEAVSSFFDYLFSEKNARRLYAYTEDYNLPSQHLCERLGMRKEGLFKEFISFVKSSDGTPIYENTLQYAILKKEWDLSHSASKGKENI